MFEVDHIVNDVLIAAIPLIIGLQTWIIKEVYSLKSNTNLINSNTASTKRNNDRLELIEDWRVRVEAVMEPDKELRKELPIALEILKQHGQELQTMRESLLLTQKEITTKLESISLAIKDIQSNCVMHKMLTAGKTDILANFINREINQKLKET